MVGINYVSQNTRWRARMLLQSWSGYWVPGYSEVHAVAFLRRRSDNYYRRYMRAVRFLTDTRIV